MHIHSTHIRKSRETKPTLKKNPASAVEPNGPNYLVSLHRKLIGGPPFRAPLPDLASLDGVNALATTLTATSVPTATVSLVWRVLTGERGKEGKKRKKFERMTWHIFSLQIVYLPRVLHLYIYIYFFFLFLFLTSPSFILKWERMREF